MSSSRARSTSFLWAFYCMFRSALCVSYYLDATCDNRGGDLDGVQDVINEIVWNSGQVANAISSRDPILEVYIELMFGFDYSQKDVLGNPWVNYVASTFNRISQLTVTTNRAAAEIRIYCDNDDRYQMVNAQGTILPKPSDRTSQEYLTGLFWDKDNDALFQGKDLLCSNTENSASVNYAAATHRLNSYYDRFRRNSIFGRSAQNEDRETVSICEQTFTAPKHGGALSLRDLAVAGSTRDHLKTLPSIPSLAPNLALILMHELVHIPLLSENTFQLPSGDITSVASTRRHVPYGTDKHPLVDARSAQAAGITRLSGYYRLYDAKTPGERLNEAMWTVMNPDSYAYTAVLYRLLGKQWTIDRQDNGYFQFEKYLGRTEKGDWPGAPDQRS